MVVTPEQLQEPTNHEMAIEGKEEILNTLKSELKSVERRIDNLLDLLNEGAIDRSMFSERIRDLQERKGQMESEIPRLEGEIAFMKISELGKDYLITKATTLYALWDTIDYNSHVKIARELTNGITVKKNELIFEYFYLPEFMELCNPDHTLMGLDTFAKYPQYRLTLPRPFIPLKGYPFQPEIGGHKTKKNPLSPWGEG
jgi:site-specific DNA recombinase